MLRVVLLAFLLSLGGARAATEVASEAALEARVAHLAERLRCLVCQNQSIAESQADLAVDLKRQVREMLVAGKSEDQIADYMVQRYGDFVLYEPPVKTSTLFLWGGPALLLLVAVGGFAWSVRRRAQAGAGPLSEADRAAARALLDGGAPAPRDNQPGTKA